MNKIHKSILRNYYTEAANYVKAASDGTFKSVEKSAAMKCDVCRKLSFDGIYQAERNQFKPYWIRNWIEAVNTDCSNEYYSRDIYVITRALHLPYFGG